jgi:tight adherence protein C
VTGAIALVLGVGWGLLAATPIVRRERRLDVASRLEVDGAARPTSTWRARTAETAALALQKDEILARWVGPVARVHAGLVARRARARHDDELAREMPVAVDLLAVAVGAGCTPYLAVEVAARWAPPAVATRLDRVRHDCALGVTFAAALDRRASEDPPLRPLVDAVLSSERYGAPVGDALARLAVEERSTLRRRAEARARTIPVRLLFPLVFLVLPAFALLSVVPVLLAGLSSS